MGKIQRMHFVALASENCRFSRKPSQAIFCTFSQRKSLIYNLSPIEDLEELEVDRAWAWAHGPGPNFSFVVHSSTSLISKNSSSIIKPKELSLKNPA